MEKKEKKKELDTNKQSYHYLMDYVFVFNNDASQISDRLFTLWLRAILYLQMELGLVA